MKLTRFISLFIIALCPLFLSAQSVITRPSSKPKTSANARATGKKPKPASSATPNPAVPGKTDDAILRDKAERFVHEGWYEVALPIYQQFVENGELSDAAMVGELNHQLGHDKEAVKWYRLGAENGYENAQYKLGYIYEKGQGVEKDYGEAVKWYSRAAERGYVDAQFAVAQVYEQVLKDYPEARKWYAAAARQNHRQAQYRLGMMCEYGLGGSCDMEEAKKWYSMAMSNGHSGAEYEMKKISKTAK